MPPSGAAYLVRRLTYNLVFGSNRGGETFASSSANRSAFFLLDFFTWDVHSSESTEQNEVAADLHVMFVRTETFE